MSEGWQTFWWCVLLGFVLGGGPAAMLEVVFGLIGDAVDAARERYHHKHAKPFHGNPCQIFHRSIEVAKDGVRGHQP